MSLHMFAMRFPDGKAKAFTVSYDDGVMDDIRFIALMRKYGIKGTFNLNSGCMPTDGKPSAHKHPRMPASQALEVYRGDDIEVAVHGVAHIHPAHSPSCVSVLEFAQDRLALEKMFGGFVRGCAYPNGGCTDDVVAALRATGIVYARTTKVTNSFDLPDGDWLRWKTSVYHFNPALPELTEKFVNGTPKTAPYLFSVWGHTYECTDKNDWHTIENTFKAVSSCEGVWFATNIEVFDYLQAFSRLVFSMDGKTVYNPTQTDIYGYTGAENICVPKGQTVHIG